MNHRNKKNWNLINARKEQGLTQKEIANKIGVTEISYQRYEYGQQKPSLDTAISIGKLLQKHVEELWGCNPAAN